MNPHLTAIRLIDRKIKGVQRELCRLEHVERFSAASWQAAWDKHPDLRAQHDGLYRERGDAQALREQFDFKQRRREQLAHARKARKA